MGIIFLLLIFLISSYIFVNILIIKGHIAAVSHSGGAIKLYDTISGKLLMTFHGRCSAEHLKFINRELIVCSYSDR